MMGGGMDLVNSQEAGVEEEVAASEVVEGEVTIMMIIIIMVLIWMISMTVDIIIIKKHRPCSRGEVLISQHFKFKNSY